MKGAHGGSDGGEQGGHGVDALIAGARGGDGCVLEGALSDALAMLPLKALLPSDVGGIGAFLDEAGFGKGRRADEGDDVLLLLVTVVILELGPGALEGRIRREGIGGVRPVAEAGEVNDAVALSNGLGQESLHITRSGPEAVILREHPEAAAAEGIVQDIAPFFEINRGSAQKYRGRGGHGEAMLGETPADV